MAIHYIDSITIDGKGNGPSRKLFNGYIYRLNYDLKMGDGKSKILANIASEDGTYTISQADLNFDRLYPIKIGTGISVNMFLEKYRLLVEPDSKLVELQFSDTSRKLDITFVGLYKKHGTISRGNLLIVGKEVHPCDKDFDGDIDDLKEIEDPCYPCRNTARKEAEMTRINCLEMSKYQIFDVMYNFDDLVAVLSTKFKIQPITNPNPKYKTKHTGSVREVLQSWCSDFGWTFYWEDETIKFLDLRKTLDVSANIEDFCPNLSAYEEEYSIEDTVQSGFISLYERAGKRQKYECIGARHFRLPVYEPGSNSTELSITSKIPVEAAGLAQYNETLRDLWYYYDYYGLRSAADYKKNQFLSKWGLTILSEPVTLRAGNNGQASSSSLQTGGLSTGSLGTTRIEPSIGLNKPAGFPENPEPTSDLAFLNSSVPTAALRAVQAAILGNLKYKMCFELLTAEEQWMVANGLVKNADDYFFYVGYYDEDAHRYHIAEERSFGSEFMGRFHIYKPDMNDPDDVEFFEDYTFRQDEICDIKIRTNDKKISYENLNDGSNDSIKFYNNPGESEDGSIDTLSSLPFAKWLTIFRDSYGDAKVPTNRQRMFKMVVVQKSGELFTPSPDSQYTVEDVEDGKVKDAIKNPKLIQTVHKHSPIIIEQKNNDKGEFIPRKVLGAEYDKTIDRSRVFICMGRAVGKDDFRMTSANGMNVTQLQGMPFDGRPIKTEYENEFDLQGKTMYRYPELKCKTIGNESIFCKRRSFQTPEAVFTYYEPTYALYGVVLEKKKEIDDDIDKLQNVFQSNMEVGSTIASLKVIERNISDDEIRVFENKNGTCRYNLEKIREFHENFVRNLDYTQKEPLVSKTFTIEGIDLAQQPKIGDGLISLSINLEQDGGIQTTYTLGTRLMTPMDEKVLRGMTNTFSNVAQINYNPPNPKI